MKKVYVGLSGGVDSAVSAAILKDRGYDVTGVFIKIWSPEFIECTWRDDRLDAMRAAVHLGIPFKEIDLSQIYRSIIIEKMIRDYKRGSTPNPDVMCNSVIKFGAFFDWARADGADIVATGHYAQIVERDGTFHLLRGLDQVKDQSYFIYELTRAHLPHVMCPVGAMQKKEVRERAKNLRLPVATKPDSQGLCFVGDITLPEFLSRFITLERGGVFDIQGNSIGEHDGAALYTLGQRHGFRVHGNNAQTPLYVVAIDTVKNVIVVAQNKALAARTEITIVDNSWTDTSRAGPFSALVQTRYREKPTEAMIVPSGNELHVKFEHAHLASPGQAAVIYDGDEVVGGGTIA